jgi:hypothetical protein
VRRSNLEVERDGPLGRLEDEVLLKRSLELLRKSGQRARLDAESRCQTRKRLRLLLGAEQVLAIDGDAGAVEEHTGVVRLGILDAETHVERLVLERPIRRIRECGSERSHGLALCLGVLRLGGGRIVPRVGASDEELHRGLVDTLRDRRDGVGRHHLRILEVIGPALGKRLRRGRRLPHHCRETAFVVQERERHGREKARLVLTAERGEILGARVLDEPDVVPRILELGKSDRPEPADAELLDGKIGRSGGIGEPEERRCEHEPRKASAGDPGDVTDVVDVVDLAARACAVRDRGSVLAARTDEPAENRVARGTRGDLT